MAQIFCPECGREINDHASQCPYCTPVASKYQTENQEKRKSHYFLWFIVVVSCVITFVCLLKTCTSSNKNSYGGSFSSFNTSADAKVCAEDAVKQVLKSPSTAKFCPSYEMTAVNMGGSKWEVTGYVDAQNTFGTFIRSNWTVTLELTEEGYKHSKVTFDD